MTDSSPEIDHDAVAVERLIEAVQTSRSDAADAAAVLVNVGDLRRLLRMVPPVKPCGCKGSCNCDLFEPLSTPPAWHGSLVGTKHEGSREDCDVCTPPGKVTP